MQACSDKMAALEGESNHFGHKHEKNDVDDLARKNIEITKL